jgi:hypothetical protein
LKENSVWLNYHIYFKSKGETCMVQEPSHVKQLSPIHMCKIGLTCEYLCEFSKTFEMTLMLFSGAWGNMIQGKNLNTKKSLDIVPSN